MRTLYCSTCHTRKRVAHIRAEDWYNMHIVTEHSPANPPVVWDVRVLTTGWDKHREPFWKAIL